MTCRDKTIITAQSAPKAVGPYSLATAGGPFVFTSGQIGLDPKTNTLVEGGIEKQTRQVLENLKAILKAGNSCLDNVVKTTVFICDMADFSAMNAVYAEYFTENQPARSTVQVAGLPKNALVEIEAMALTCKEGHCD
jgi:2-iminobutanoate/2-iminopropanoate deaminase